MGNVIVLCDLHYIVKLRGLLVHDFNTRRADRKLDWMRQYTKDEIVPAQRLGHANK